MKHYVKNLYDFASKPNSIPEFIWQREHLKCPLCGREIVIAVPPTGVDWERVAREYQAYAKKMWMECNLLLSEAGMDTLLEKQLREILDRCKETMGV